MLLLLLLLVLLLLVLFCFCWFHGCSNNYCSCCYFFNCCFGCVFCLMLLLLSFMLLCCQVSKREGNTNKKGPTSGTTSRENQRGQLCFQMWKLWWVSLIGKNWYTLSQLWTEQTKTSETTILLQESGSCAKHQKQFLLLGGENKKH